jgi:hypothetical protein
MYLVMTLGTVMKIVYGTSPYNLLIIFIGLGRVGRSSCPPGIIERKYGKVGYWHTNEVQL